MATRKMKMKICLVGAGAVGKTCLIRRFVLDEFDDSYLQTIGTKVSKKELVVSLPGNGHEMLVDMTIWDIMGQRGFRDLLKEAYFYGAQGVLAVCDITRKSTLPDLDDWIHGVYGVTGKVPVHLLANKVDLRDDDSLEESSLNEVASEYESPFHFSSAVTGENVEEAFRSLAARVAAKRMGE